MYTLLAFSDGPVDKKVKVAQLCPTLCDPMDYTYSPWNSPGQNTGVGGCPFSTWVSHIAGAFFTS